MHPSVPRAAPLVAGTARGDLGLSPRTVQRLEQGKAVDFDTRRALARAFELEDIDALNKPFSIPTAGELKVAKEEFDRENVTLTMTPLDTGRQLAQLVERCEMDYAEPAFDLSREAAEAFAGLVDVFREYRECSELYSEVQKLEVHDDFQGRIDELKALGVCLCHGERKMQAKLGIADPASRPVPLTALYLIAFPLGKAPDKIVTPKAAQIRC